MSKNADSRSNDLLSNLKIEQDDIKKILSIIGSNRPEDIFSLDVARYVVGKRRFEDSKKVANLNVADDGQLLWPDTIDLAKKGLSDFGSVARSSRLVRCLAAIDKVYLNSSKLSALSIGPRTEMELLSLVGHGFRPENVRGLDLLSYSPWIDVGNAHEMPYEDSSYDVIIAGWILVYSSNPEQMCNEIIRVSKNGAVIAIGTTYWPPAKRAKEDPDRTNLHYPMVVDLLKMFDGFIDQVYVRHDPPNINKEGRTILVFDVKK